MGGPHAGSFAWRSRTNGLLLALVLLGIFALYLYRLNAPFWLDEIYGYRLARRGFDAILANSWTDPHPPGYYIIQWFVSDSGQIKSEIAWRWTSVLCGLVGAIAIWKSARSTVPPHIALAACTVFATLPSVVFYSQEARPYIFGVAAAAVTAWLTTLLLTRATPRLWYCWLTLSALGLSLGYSYLMILGIQVLYLGRVHYRKRAWWFSCVVLGLGAMLLLPYAISSMGRVAQAHADAPALTLWQVLQSLLSNDPVRYGMSWTNWIMPLMILGLLASGAIRILRERRVGRVYLLAQVAVPFGLFALAGAFAGLTLPVSEGKQFLVLLPMMLVVAANGLAVLGRVRGSDSVTRAGLVAGACGIAIFTNAVGIQRYWLTPKSPEGALATRVRSVIQPGEPIVSLHYSLSFAIGYYIPEVRLYLNPQMDEGGYTYKSIVADEFLAPVGARPVRSLADVRSAGAFWLLAHASASRESFDELVALCSVTAEESAPPFAALRVDCSR